MGKAIYLNKMQCREIAGLDWRLRFGALTEVAAPTAAPAQPETRDVSKKRQVRQLVEDPVPDVSRENRRILKNKNISGAAISPYFLLFLKDVTAFAAISAYVATICIFSQEIAPKLSEFVRNWGLFV